MSAALVIPSVFTAVDKFSGPMKGMGDAVQGFVSRSERYLGRANAMFSRLMTPITNINRMLMGLGYYVGLFTLIRIIKNAIDIFADFQQANADLAVVMGLSVKQNKVLADDARRIGLNYGVAATEVVKMQHALATLGFEQSDILKMGRPLITGSSALEGADPERLAQTIGAVINAFDNLGTGDTQHILDVMALSANRTALNFDKLATTLPIVSGPANAVGVDFERLVALLGVLQNSGVHVATSATSLKNIFIDSAKKGHTYEQVLDNIAKNSNKLVYANKQFGKRSVVSALALSAHMNDAKNGVVALTEEFRRAQVGLTDLIAIQRLDTFRGAQKLLNAAWNEFVLSIEDGTGSLAQSMTRILKVASAVLLLSSDSDQAREAISKMDSEIVDTARRWQFWGNVIMYVVAALIAVRVALAIWGATLAIVRGVMIAYNVVSGIMAAVTMASSVSIVRGTAYMYAYRAAMLVVTAAQWAFNVAMDANPVMLVITAVLGLAAAFGILDNSYNKVNGSMNKWQDIMKGTTMQNVDPTGFDKIQYWLDRAAFGQDDAKKFLIERVNNYGDDYKERNTIAPAINPKADDQSKIDSLMNSLSGIIKLDINDPGNNVKNVRSDSSFIMPRVSNTNTYE